MAEARFIQLAYPFALVGAAAGWLSAAVITNPAFQRIEVDLKPPVTVVTGVLGAGLGALLTHLCRGKKLDYELEDWDIARRSARDSAWLHALLVVCCGALVGLIIGAVHPQFNSIQETALGGAGCALLFLPVCLTVLRAARRAKRARLGSIVSDSDRRSVWALLATTMAVMTLFAAVMWPAARAGEVELPLPMMAMLWTSLTATTVCLVHDVRAIYRAHAVITPDLVQKHASEVEHVGTDTPRVDLGLGEELAARVAMSAAAYRGRDRTLALVQGNAEEALAALHRAGTRTALAVLVVLATVGVHIGANTDLASLHYLELRCEQWDFQSCHEVADLVKPRHVQKARDLYERACGATSPESCFQAGLIIEEMANGENEASLDSYERAQHLRNRATNFFSRACKYKVSAACLAMYK
ncbi:MAG: hypothetical protein IPK82_06135 [Polyangiaceae bacterium]|nr:hypothetical protein [Polyangiaceae bacterium]